MYRWFDYRYYDKRSWDNTILAYISLISEFKGKQELLLKQKPIVLSRLMKVAQNQSVEGSNRIENIFVPKARIKQLCEENTTPNNEDEKQIAGYRDALNFINENYDSVILNQDFILHLHKILYQHSEFDIGGKLKSTQNYICEFNNEGDMFIRFTPLDPHLTAEALDSICKSYNEMIINESLHPLLLIPIFIHDFLCIHPFDDGNGRVSRLLTSLLLYRSGYYVGRYIGLEKKIEKTREIYYEVLDESSHGWHKNNNNPLPFIEYMLGEILASYRNLEDRLKPLETKANSLDVVSYATKSIIGRFTKADVLALCPSLERSSVAAALKQLVEEGELKRYGTGKATYYVRIK